jgi:lysophospholipase L1-like esterase
VTSTPRKKQIVFKLLTTLISSSVCILVLVGADLYLHYKHGINLRGYRGPSVGRKQAGEKRVAILGGSTTWGFGLKAGQDFPAQLQKMLAERNDVSHQAPVNVLNLGFNNEGAYSFKFTLKDYAYLEPDVVVLYSGYNDVNQIENKIIFRHRSPVFLWTGFLPLLPSLTMDKLTVWKRKLSGSDERTIFEPPDVKKIKNGDVLRQQVGSLTQKGATTSSTTATCAPEWKFYCEQISETVSAALKDGKRVLVVTEPYISDKHVEQQAAIANMLSVRFADNPNVHYLNLGTAVDLRDPSLCWDGMHLTQEGNRRIAAALVQPVGELLPP